MDDERETGRDTTNKEMKEGRKNIEQNTYLGTRPGGTLPGVSCSVRRW
jgi:hypothetical protein